MTQQITRQDMVSWMETDGCAEVAQRPRLHWSRIDTYVAKQLTGEFAGSTKGFHLFEYALSGTQHTIYDSKMEPGNSKTQTVKAGVVQYQPADSPTRIQVEGDITFQHILIDDSIFQETWAALFPGDPANMDLWTFIGAYDEHMRHAAKALLDEARVPSFGGELYAEALARQIALLVLRRQHGTSPRKSSANRLSDREFAMIVDHIHAHLDDPGGAKVLAQLLDMNPYAFIRAFKNRAGVPPHRFVSEMRIDAVKRLLADTNDSLADIAYATGFSSQSHMTNAFSRYTGVTPGAYRRRANA